MGRALLVCLISSLIFTLVTPNAFGERQYSGWDEFAKQFQLLVRDDKHSLAERLLNNRLPEMETYIKDQAEEVRTVWDKVSPSIVDEEITAQDAEALKKFISFLVASDSKEWVNHQIEDIQLRSMDSKTSAETLVNEWDELSPYVAAFVEEEELLPLKVAFSQLGQHDTMQTRDHVVQSLPILEQDWQFKDSALLFTVIIIGGTIVFTLFYVALRRFIANRKSGHKRSENS
ncbi:hypothetical protein LCM20_07160 [Halobacillus litoralis]|uniref:hypothetical protein n=1 Tax=Halobacillus litoralis TaxID=45668 RepID=UPI001CD24BC2|nr:hypothetical protein [Halobacillus litoralis]MCA0970363.1 hypothetical protein [Halobacillus litoralis]